MAVHAYDDTNGYWFTTNTDSDGTYQLQVRLGYYRVGSFRQCTPSLLSFSMNVATWENAQLVLIADGETGQRYRR